MRLTVIALLLAVLAIIGGNVVYIVWGPHRPGSGGMACDDPLQVVGADGSWSAPTPEAAISRTVRSPKELGLPPRSYVRVESSERRVLFRSTDRLEEVEVTWKPAGTASFTGVSTEPGWGMQGGRSCP